MLNHITIMGRMVREPELRYTQSNTPVASFTLAVDRDYKQDGSDRATDFIDCVAWRGTGEFVSKYFTKGSMAVVSGRLQIRDWTDRDGNKRKSAEVVADNVYFCEKKNTASKPSKCGFDAERRNHGMYEPYGETGRGGNEVRFDDDDGELPF